MSPGGPTRRLGSWGTRAITMSIAVRREDSQDNFFRYFFRRYMCADHPTNLVLHINQLKYILHIQS